MTTPSTDVIPASFLPGKALTKISETHRRAAEKCIRRRIPFVLYAERPKEEYTFYADYPYTGDSEEDEFGAMAHLSTVAMKPTKGERKFYVGFFDQQETPITIKEKLSAEEVLATELQSPSILRNPIIRTKRSTEKMVYQSQVFALKTRLKSDKVSGKVVLSKVVATASAKPIFEVVDEYFQSTPSVFRAVYFHPLTGLWIVATPEVLFKYNKVTCDLATMALAGTRPTPATDGEPWSAKNLREHKYVVRYLLKELKECLITPDYPKEPLTLPLGGIEHLCTPITGHRAFTRYQFETTVMDLSPTPAVAGFPRDYALEQISSLELHNRYCYGGWLGPDKGDEANIYVNLRSALLFPEYDNGGKLTNCFYNIYAGGGILAQSNPKEEWEETELKCQTLRRILGVRDSSSEPAAKDSPESSDLNRTTEASRKQRATIKKDNRSK